VSQLPLNLMVVIADSTILSDYDSA
jgi:hypothetical protein